MALEDINLSYLGLVKQQNVNLSNNSVVTLVEGDPDQRIWVWRFDISSDLASKFIIRSGDNVIFEMHGGQKWGSLEPSESRAPRLLTNEGEDLTIQAIATSLYANVYMQWQVRAIEGV